MQIILFCGLYIRVNGLILPMSVTNYIFQRVHRPDSIIQIRPMEWYHRKAYRLNMPFGYLVTDNSIGSIIKNQKSKIMRMLKWVIMGEILMVLVKFHPHEKLFTLEEKRIYYELKKCVVILSKENDGYRIENARFPSLIKLCLTSFILFPLI